MIDVHNLQLRQSQRRKGIVDILTCSKVDTQSKINAQNGQLTAEF